MNTLTERLAQLEYLELDLANVIDEAAERIKDPEVSKLMHDIADDHEQQAFELDELLAATYGVRDVPPESKTPADSVARRVHNSADQGAIVDALLDAERDDYERHQMMLDADVPQETAELLQRHIAIEAEHINFFENRAPAMAPDIHGSRSMPGKGFGAF